MIRNTMANWKLQINLATTSNIEYTQPQYGTQTTLWDTSMERLVELKLELQQDDMGGDQENEEEGGRVKCM